MVIESTEAGVVVEEDTWGRMVWKEGDWKNVWMVWFCDEKSSALGRFRLAHMKTN